VQQTGDEKLLSLAQECEIGVNSDIQPGLTHSEVRIPVIIVFTKFDYLIKEQRKNAKKASKIELERKAEDCFNDRIKGLKASTQASIVRVSTDKDYPRLSLYIYPSRPETS